MFEALRIDLRKQAGLLIVGATLFTPCVGAIAADSASSGPTYLAALSPDDAFEQAMRLLRRPDASTPTREEVDRAGHMLMGAGPGAFERAMQLLQRTTQYSSDAEIEAAKKQMVAGGPDAHTKAMQLLMQSFGYK